MCPVLRRPISTSCAGTIIATALVVGSLVKAPSAQPIPVNYSVHLASATSYDTRSRDEDTVHASLTVLVNGERRGGAIWDGKGWDGSRAEGRRWVSGLHLFGPSTGSTVQVATGRLQDTDTVEIILQLLNSTRDPSEEDHQSVAARIHQTPCAGADGASAWDCIAPLADSIVAGWPLAGCDGLLAADKLAYTAMQLRRRTETGDTVTVSNLYRGTPAPAGCGQSIYAAIVTIARQ
jgi:hypothetical protein